MARAWRALLDLLFPPRCPGCRRVGAWFCTECQSRLQPPPVRVVGRPSASIEGLATVALYTSPLREAIHQFKYGDNCGLAWVLGQHLTAAWEDACIPVDELLPVPLHPSRLAERGYNQSLLLARVVAGQTGLPLVEGALVRRRATRPQVALTTEERLTNVRGAFSCEQEVRGRRILLIDDISTTGATLEACGLALRASGAAEVWAAALAKARWQPWERDWQGPPAEHPAENPSPC
jgi:ComF family protein